eukprot:TRINITY_DN19208_c0_g1_i1.p1 TRINITY_DN19208_c0_g1~~TRINITY_DN19208_c0_g1_i1.p1  ORF type:complete len:457 (+),score=72.76 TRINITY_DN19208_c0_g1_i1:85-1455(+)
MTAPSESAPEHVGAGPTAELPDSPASPAGDVNVALLSESREGEAGEGSTDAPHLFINLVTGGLGAGILSMPWAAAGASVITSAAITAVVLLLNVVTIWILVEAGEREQKFDIGALLACLPGKLGDRARWVTEACVWASMWMTLVGYMIVVADSLTAVMPNSEPLQSRRFWVSIGSVLCLPLCYLNQKYLAFTSALSVAVNVYLMCYVTGHSATLGADHDLPDGFCLLGFTVGNVVFMSNMMFSTVLQMCVLPMYRELKGRSPRRFCNILAAAFAALWVLFVGFASVGYLAYGSKVDSNVLNNLPRNVPGHAARIGMLFVILGVYPIMQMPMVEPIRTWEALQAGSDAKQDGGGILLPIRWRSGLATLGIVFSSMGLAFVVKDLGFMNAVNGALCAVVFVGLGPGLVGLNLCDRESLAWRASMVVLVVACVALAALGFAFTDNYSSKLQAHCLWSAN